MTPIEEYLRQAAIARGIDPDIAVRVARSEGGLKNPFRRGEGPAPRSQRFPGTEHSFGPMQLYISGSGAGLGDRAVAAGIDPRTNWKGGIDFALNEVRNKGWGQWYGAKAAGITGFRGVNRGGVVPPTMGTTLNSYGPDGPKGQEKYLPPLPSRVVNDHPIADMPAETQTSGAFPSAPEAPDLIDRFKANAFTPDAKGATPFGGMMDVLAKAMGGNDEAMNIEPTGNLAAMEQADATRFAAAQQLLAQLMAKKRSIV